MEGRRREEGGRRKEEGGRRKEEGGGRKEEGEGEGGKGGLLVHRIMIKHPTNTTYLKIQAPPTNNSINSLDTFLALNLPNDAIKCFLGLS
jgi:hypothetical protein